MPLFQARPADEGPVPELKACLGRETSPSDLPPWFADRLLHEIRRRRRDEPDTERGGLRFLMALLQPRFAIPALLVAALAGGWLGYAGAHSDALHLAEVRYLDEIDPVHRHP